VSTTQLRPAPARPIDPPRLLAVATELAARRDRWPSELRFDPDRRWYTRIPAQDNVDAWLLTWLPGQSTGLHDHGEASGVFVVVEGLVRETNVIQRPGGGVRDVVRTFATGEARPFGGWHVHDVANPGPLPAISLHVYTPALTTMRRYRRYGDALVQVAVQLAGQDW